MKRCIIGLVLFSTTAVAAQAFWTGNQQPIQTVTGISAWNCEYQYNGQRIWRIFQTSCPSSIEVY